MQKPNPQQHTNNKPVVVYLLLQTSSSGREVKQPSEKLQSDQIAVSHRAAHLKMLKSPLEVQVDAVSGKLSATKLLSRCTNQLSVGSRPSEPITNTPPSPRCPYCHKALTDLFVFCVQFFVFLFFPPEVTSAEQLLERLSGTVKISRQ